MRATLFFAAAIGLASIAASQAATVKLLNVSYDPTRELYKHLGDAFAKQWKSKTGSTLELSTSNGGSGAQARAVIDGLQADVVTLALAADIDAIAQKAGLLPADWQKRLPQNSTPYTSTIVFLVRKGNPWKIKDWTDLVKPGIQVMTPNPEDVRRRALGLSGGLGLCRKGAGRQCREGQGLCRRALPHVPVLDTGARGSTMTFTKRGIGDVLLSWENEAHLALKESPGQYEIVYPSPLHPGRAAGGAGGQECRPAQATARRRKPS